MMDKVPYLVQTHTHTVTTNMISFCSRAHTVSSGLAWFAHANFRDRFNKSVRKWKWLMRWGIERRAFSIFLDLRHISSAICAMHAESESIDELRISIFTGNLMCLPRSELSHEYLITFSVTTATTTKTNSDSPKCLLFWWYCSPLPLQHHKFVVHQVQLGSNVNIKYHEYGKTRDVTSNWTTATFENKQFHFGNRKIQKNRQLKWLVLIYI